MNIAVVVFVKTPGVSSFKTRLRRGLGDELTNEFYARCIDISHKFVSNLKTLTSHSIIGYWAIAEEEGYKSNYWSGLTKIYQGEGRLGERLAKVYSEINNKFDAVFFIGSDSPQIDAVVVNRMIEDFCESADDFLLGNTIDGGFYLFGGKKHISNQIWESVEYSCDTTANQLIEKLESAGTIMKVDESFDIDTYEDLNKLVLVNPNELFLEQKKLVLWIKEVLGSRAKNITG